MALVADTLIISILLPLLLFEQLEPSETLDEDMAEKMMFAINALIGFAFYIACVHVTLSSMFYIVSSYFTDVMDILWFFATFYRWITLINVALIPLIFCFMSIGALGNIVLYGFPRAIPVCGLCVFTIVATFVSVGIVSSRMKARFRASHRHHVEIRPVPPSSAEPPKSLRGSGTTGQSVSFAADV